MDWSSSQSPIKVAAYLRVSTLLGQTTDNQAIPIREFCKARGFDLTEDREYSDIGISGAQERRPGLDRLLADAKRGKFKVLVVGALDRCGRNVKNILTLLDELSALGVKFISLRENIDLSTPQGQMIMTVLAAFSQLEREITRQRIRESLATRKLLATKTGSGWRCGRPQKVDAEIIRRVLELRSQGLSIRSIATALGKQISHATVGKILLDTNGPSNGA